MSSHFDFDCLRKKHGRGARATGVLFLLAVALNAAAQPVPVLKSVTPDSLQRGHTTTLTVTGDNLAGASQVLIVGPPGVSATLKPVAPTTKPITTLSVEVATAADAPRGLRELRLVTKDGVTKPILVSVDDLPAVAEKEPNNSPGE